MGSYAPPAQFFQIQSTSYITSMDISSSAHTLAFGDAASFVYQFTDRDVYDVNPYSMGLSTADVVEVPEVHMTEESPLSSVGLPYYTEPLLSNWPLYPSVFDASCPPPHIDDELLKNMKTVDFVGYAPNPGLRRNQAPRKKKPLHNRRNGPKFRSEQERDMLLSNSILDDQEQHRGEHRTSSVADISATDPMALNMPSYYRRVEIQYSKFGVEDFDFEYYNRTCYGGLETHIRNSFCNSLLQVLYFTVPLRRVATSHIKSLCSHPKCFLCELGFLFRMLEASHGQNCQATNFCRTLTMSPKAAALSLFEPDIPDPSFSYSSLIQSFARFLLEELHGEAFQPDDTNPVISKLLDSPNPSTIQQLFGVQTLFTVECASSWCSTCRRYRPLTTKRTVLALPNALFINAGTAYPEDEALWRQNGPGSPRNNNSKQDNSNDGGSDPPRSNPWVPERFGIHINGSEVVIKPLLPGSDIPEEFQKTSKTCAIYELAASIVEVKAEDEDPHLVAQIKIPPDELDSSSTSPWYLFNDFLVRNIREEETMSFKGKWKAPSILQYKRVDSDESLDLSGLPDQADCSILFNDTTVANRPAVNPKYQILTADEMPKKGTLVALDTEFVALKREVTEIRSDGTKSLIRPSTLVMARLSVIRGEGPKEGVPFIDDYIEITEEVEDYLTEFSGITALDINPNTTTHTLVDHKMAYAKLRLLADLGCVFIGHGLVKDFRTINILVPPEQIIDTVDIYHIRDRQRKISLRFLAWHLLGQDIQSEGHDSIEDAETALVLFRKYQEYKKTGEFGKVIEGVYVAGMRSNWLKKPTRELRPPFPGSPRP
ncbi:ubiquitin carboxyl-terminal hydrolase-domain-containing protein [Zychaea mexicana]|uniref:ubiquitin carboxyl-terminal hydrolase-domain-containing protein n=1 Tax=Zychaea mexicana TaxID=64656 RepID=UPI0022FE230D|nr:ubiquitin carboxyl-terminal hydrolase-domain-containing protein [Zychaea mexicana]KAI9494041.1 ubiquitin carboxyl-terminal hydrolase-domain-containing protein [Zychaea mexicana]